MTSAVATTNVIADVDGAQTGDAGPVIWTAYTTNDTTAPAASPALTLAGRDFLSFTGFSIQGGNTTNSCVDASTANSTNISFTRCVFTPGLRAANFIRYQGTGGQAANWTLDSCVIGASGSTSIYISLPTLTGADYDANFVVKNCLFLGSNGGNSIYIDSSGALANKGGGVICLNSTFFGASFAMRCPGPNLSTSIPCRIYNGVIQQCDTGLGAAAVGQLVEDYNLIHATTPRSNVTAGGNSIATFATAPALDWGYSMLNGFLMRPVFMPIAGAPELGFGNSGAVTAPTSDILGRPRPAGGGSVSNGIGAFERHDTGAREASVVDASTYSLKLTGPADHDLLIPVNAAATTITVRGRYDTNHATTNKPQVILQANGEIGVATQTVTMTVGVDTWETLTIGPFTPSAKGFVTVRLVARSAAGNGIAYFDTITASPAIGTGSEDYWRRGEAFPAATTTKSSPWSFP